MLGEETKSDCGVHPTAHENEKELCDQSGEAGKAGKCNAESGDNKYSTVVLMKVEGRGVETSKRRRKRNMEIEGCFESGS